MTMTARHCGLAGRFRKADSNDNFAWTWRLDVAHGAPRLAGLEGGKAAIRFGDAQVLWDVSIGASLSHGWCCSVLLRLCLAQQLGLQAVYPRGWLFGCMETCIQTQEFMQGV